MNQTWQKIPLFSHLKDAYENFENGYPRWSLSDDRGRILAYIDLNTLGFFNLYILHSGRTFPMFETAEKAMNFAMVESLQNPKWFQYPEVIEEPKTMYSDIPMTTKKSRKPRKPSVKKNDETH